MRRILLGGIAAGALLGCLPAGAAAAPLYSQCPAIGADTGCQFVVVVTDGGQQLLTDAAQQPYDGTEDALIGVQNSSSKPLATVPISSPGAGGLFGFEGDGICNPGVGNAAPGCVMPPSSSGGANTPCPTAGGTTCSFPPPPGEGAKYVDPGGSPVNTFPNGDQQNGYEGPTSWYTNVPSDESAGVVHFDPPLAPGATTYFSLEEPPTGNLVIGTPSTVTSTTLSGGGSTGASITVAQGAPVTDQAVVATTSGSAATGSVSYAVFSDSACTKKVADAGSGAVGAGGSAASSAAQTLPVGTFYWQATYNGDSQNAPATSPCSSEVLKVLAPTSVTTTLSAGTNTGAKIAVAPGTAVTDVAQISGPSAATATGTVTYALFKDAACKVPAGAAGTAPVSAGGKGGPSAPQKLAAGTYYWQATYSGDGTNSGSASPCGTEVLSVASASKTVGLPKAKRCVSRRKFVIHVRVPKGQSPASGAVYINGALKQNVTFGGGRASTINLKGLPKGRFQVAVIVTAQSGNAYTDHRRYKTCTPKGH